VCLIVVVNPPYAKRNSVFRRKGGESPLVKGGSPSRTTGAEGHPVCTSEVLGARKIGEEAAEVAWPRSLTDGGFTPHR